jgi:hypothetical protein
MVRGLKKKQIIYPLFILKKKKYYILKIKTILITGDLKPVNKPQKKYWKK